MSVRSFVPSTCLYHRLQASCYTRCSDGVIPALMKPLLFWEKGKHRVLEEAPARVWEVRAGFLRKLMSKLEPEGEQGETRRGCKGRESRKRERSLQE